MTRNFYHYVKTFIFLKLLKSVVSY